MNTIDIVMPTMWKVADLPQYLDKYCESDKIGNFFLVDNNRQGRPKDLILHPKITVIDYGKNIYVNPAWNEGYFRSQADVICILNDDLDVDPTVFDYMSDLDFTDIDLIGVHLKGGPDNYHVVAHPDKREELIRLNLDKTKAIGGQAYAFGCCMFVKRSSYRVIPSLYQVWYGDDYLVQKSQNVYAFKTSKIKGEISKTLTSDAKNEIQKRIDLDSHNVFKYNHFLNGKNWDHVLNNLVVSKKTKPQPVSIKDSILETEYRKARQVKSDINENVHILYDLAKECKTVTEMGVRTGVSTRAFLASDVKLISYDIQLHQEVTALFQIAKALGKDAVYKQADVLRINIDETDLLFIDTLHTYSQLKQELKLHGNKARKYLAFHDTHTFGLRGEVGNEPTGLLSAVIEFVMENPHWRFKIYKMNNNGMTVLERVNCQ